MNQARKTFKGLYWPFSDYTRAFAHPYTKDMVKHQRWGDDGYEEYLVFFPDGRRSWTKNPEYAYLMEKIEPRWKPVTSHALRKVSLQTLMNEYGLDDVSCAYYGGWTISGNRTGVSASMSKHYMHMDLREAETALPQLMQIFQRYASKLLIDYDLLK